MFTKSAEVYFDSVTMIITFVFAGKYLEVLTRKKAVDTLDAFGSAMPSEVMVIKGNEKSFVSAGWSGVMAWHGKTARSVT
jgi:Cu+-exporting ATPase